ncbi:DMP19 family protein [Polaribacter sp.]|nr:DMP19 family protein [Polaribacter sp.]MDB4201421.1 DMP19 family protein [Polaribacter sp.]MDC1354712.1 DMP19 family protein [Polaribacter sp.]MDC1461459.1 DMP19 family protein [Polaribacter sp.]MDC1514945.1 DMP19 family protein [Polaribacter sp.]
MTSTEIALLLNSDLEKVVRIGEIIGKKIPERDEFSGLNDCEKTFIYIDIFENHTTNGGFEEFFWNSSGQFSHEILAAYEAIGANKTATLIYNAFKEFGEIPIPKDHAFRKKILTELNSNAWDTLDQAFYKSKEAIVPLVLRFVAKNSAYFD